MQPHLEVIEDHESGRVQVDEETMRRAVVAVSFYERILHAYDEQCKQREQAPP